VRPSLLAAVFGSTTLSSTDLYWWPDQINNVGGKSDYLPYESAGNNSSWSNLSGYIVYYNGHFYKSTSANYNGTKVTVTSVAMDNTKF